MSYGTATIAGHQRHLSHFILLEIEKYLTYQKELNK